MKIATAEFLVSAVSPAQYPRQPLPEVAFAGRSNVGKSSLINTLVHRKNLVKTSSTPGKTRTINFFVVNQRFLLVDLPGYIPRRRKTNNCTPGSCITASLSYPWPPKPITSRVANVQRMSKRSVRDSRCLQRSRHCSSQRRIMKDACSFGIAWKRCSPQLCAVSVSPHLRTPGCGAGLDPQTDLWNKSPPRIGAVLSQVVENLCPRAITGETRVRSMNACHICLRKCNRGSSG